MMEEDSSNMKGVDLFAIVVGALKLEKLKATPLTTGGVMAGSVATIAILWVLIQTMGFFVPSDTIGTFKVPFSLDSYVATSPPGVSSWSQVVDTSKFSHKKLPPVDEKVMNFTVDFASAQISRLQRMENNIVSARVTPNKNSPAHKQYVHSYPSEAATEKFAEAMVAIAASSQLLNNVCVRYGLDEAKCAHYISTLKLDNTPLGASCAASQEIDCNSDAKYRSLDGTCNNLQNPKWGSALTAYQRLLFPQYADVVVR